MEKIKARLVIEIMGRPPEHLKETVKLLVDRIAGEKGLLILNKEFHEPKKVDKTENLFSTFTEIDIEFGTLELFFAVITGYMPSHVEVYEPDKIKFNINELNNFSNFIISRMHRYDEIAKGVLVQRDILLSQLEYLKKGGKIEEIIKAEQNAQANIHSVQEKKENSSKKNKKSKVSKKKN